MKPATSELVSVNEKVEIQAQKAFYEKVALEMGKAQLRRLEFWRRMTLVYTPLFALTFAGVYWVAGLKHIGIL